MSGEGQTSGTVLMVRPASFGFHAEAADSNAFAHEGTDTSAVLREFDGAVEALDRAGIEVLVLDDTPKPPKPDAVFPNNWVSFHADGTMVLYPMATAARRLERDPDRLKSLLEARRFEVRRTVDLSFHERHGHFLEGTGSLVVDRARHRAFASRSPRTDATVIADFDDRLDYSTFIFDAHDRSRRPIYHTNVLLSFGSDFAGLFEVRGMRRARRGRASATVRTANEAVLTYPQVTFRALPDHPYAEHTDPFWAWVVLDETNVGLWKRSIRGDEVEVDVRLARSLGDEGRAAVREAAQRLADFLELELRYLEDDRTPQIWRG